MLHHSVSLWNLAFYALMVFMATLGLWDVFFGFEENKCSMSYMFEYPEYQVRFCPPSLALLGSGPSSLTLRCVSPASAPRASPFPFALPRLCFLSPRILRSPPRSPSPALSVLSSRRGP